MANNRIELLAAHMSAGTREDGLAALDAGLQAGDEAPLSVDESRLLTQWLARERSAYAQAYLWRLLYSGPLLPEAVNLALRWLEELQLGHRGAALAYLRRHRPDLMPRLAEQFSRDSDAGVRYELAQFWLPTRPDEAVDLMIDALAGADHEGFDAMTFEICEYGKSTHLERLGKLDADAGGNSGFGRVAEALRSRLEGD